MRRMMMALTTFYRRWKYVEEEKAGLSPAASALADGEPQRLRRAIEREEQLLADYRRNRCDALARGCESTLRSLRNRLAALEF